MPETTHTYLSTGCLHGKHSYCQGTTGQTGAKVPARCKFCEAPCQCPCHREQRLSIDQITSDELDDLYEELAGAREEINRLTAAEAEDIAAGSYAGRVTELEQHLVVANAELTHARADVVHRDTVIRNLDAGLATERATIARVKDLITEMRTWSLPHSQLGRYVDRTLTALGDLPTEPEQPPVPAPLPEYIDISEYRHDRGHKAWAVRCWGDGICDGHLSLDNSDEAYARKSAHRHLADHHGITPPAAP